MQFCEPHIKQLRDAIKLRGLYQFCAQSEEEANEYAEALMDGDDEDMFEPMIASQCLIFEAAILLGGDYLMTNAPDGSRYCPCCELNKKGSLNSAEILINAAADEVLNAAIQNGLLGAEKPN